MLLDMLICVRVCDTLVHVHKSCTWINNGFEQLCVFVTELSSSRTPGRESRGITPGQCTGPLLTTTCGNRSVDI